MLPARNPRRNHPSYVSRRIARNTVYLGLADAASKTISLLFVLIAARHLGVESFGALSFAFAYVAIFASLTDLGLGVVVAREIAREPECAQSFADNAFTIRILVSLMLMAAVFVSVQMLGYGSEAVYLARVTSLYLVANSATLLYASIFQGFEKMSLAAIARLFQTLILIAGALILIRFEPSPIAFAWLYVASMVSGAGFSWLLSGRVGIRPRFSLDPRFWKRLIRDSLPIGLAAAFGMLYYWGGTALITKFRGELAAGLFSAPFRLVLGGSFLSHGFAGAIYPVAARLFTSDTARAVGFTTRALRYIAILSAGTALLGTFLARPVIEMLYGPEYEGSIRVLQILAWWGGFVSFNVVLSNLLYAARFPRPVAWQTLISLLVSVGTGLLLIPRLSATGAALGLVAAELTGTIFLYVALLRLVCRPILGQVFLTLIKAAGSAVVAGLAGYFIGITQPSIGVLLALAFFAALLYISGTITSNDRHLLKAIFRRAELDATTSA